MEPVALFSTGSDLAGVTVTCVHCLTKRSEAIYDRLLGKQIRTGAAFDVDLTCRWSYRSWGQLEHGLQIRQHLT